MEREVDLKTLDYREMVWEIVCATRKRAATVPYFQKHPDGCIRITLVPLSQAADEWIGGFSKFAGWVDYKGNDLCEKEYVFKLDPIGSHTMQYVTEGGHVEPVNCYGYSTLKVAYASRERAFLTQCQKTGISAGEAEAKLAEHMKYCTEANGFSKEPGTLCVTLNYHSAAFLRIYVTVSGAIESKDDEIASFGGILGLQQFCLNISDQMEPDADDQPAFSMALPKLISAQET